jgi:hypothetical protein
MGLFGSDQDRFGKLAARIAREMVQDRPVSYDADEFAVRLGEGTVIYLGNIYQESHRSEREGALRRLISAMVEREETGWPQVTPQLRPVLRPVGFGLTGTGRAVPLRRPAVPHLDEYVVIDRPTSMAYVTDTTLAEWGVDAEAVFAAARANLAHLAQPPSPDYSNKLTNYVAVSGDEYYSSWLLDPDWLADLPGTPVVFIAEQNSALLVDASNGHLTPLYAMVEKTWSEAVRSLSPVGYTRRGGGLAPYTVAAGHPDAAAIGRAQRLLAGSSYSQQKARLEREHEALADPPYVASLLVMERDGAVSTVAPWADEITSWLPEADYVAMGPLRSLIPWSAVVGALALTPIPDLVPTRYEVGAWPTGAALEVLLAAAV